jgi:hypothetical protein
MVVLQRITPSRLTPPKFAPVKSAPVKLVGGISELVSLSVVAVTLLPSNPIPARVFRCPSKNTRVIVSRLVLFPLILLIYKFTELTKYTELAMVVAKPFTARFSPEKISLSVM